MTETNYALTHLYHRSGAKVDIPIDMTNGITPDRAAVLIYAIDALIGAGLTVTMPGLEDGEMTVEVNALSRRASNDGVPILAFYKPHPKLFKKFIHHYFDTADQIEEFESASGLKFASLPVFDGDKDITKDHRLASRYIVTLPKPLTIVYRISERWQNWKNSGEAGNEPKKYELLRYLTNGNGHTAPVTAQILQAMTYEQAQAVLTPGGVELRNLDEQKLAQLSASHAANVTEEMRQAANVILAEIKKEGS